MKLIYTTNYLILINENNKLPEKGDFFIILYNDESYLDVNLNTLDNFLDYANSDFTEECYKIIGYLALEKNAPSLAGIPQLPQIPTSEVKFNFSLEDMKKAIEMATHINPNNTDRFYSKEEIIQSLSTQQLPKEFIPEIEQYTQNYHKDIWYNRIKTITNSEGKEFLVGTYKY